MWHRVVTTGGEGSDHMRDMRLVELEDDSRWFSSTFFHSAWRLKVIIPSTLYLGMLCSLAKAISLAGLNYFIKYS
jgi:hypothetical protein